MKTSHTEIITLNTISDYTRINGLDATAHPLLTLIDFTKVINQQRPLSIPIVQHFYSVWIKKNLRGKLYYGHQSYDFDQGVMGFMAPGQVFSVNSKIDVSELTGWMLLFHPDLLQRYPLGKKMASYGYFSYSANEALHLSAKEEATLDAIVDGIRNEYEQPIDAFSQDVIVSQLEVLLNLANRYYHRQFHSRRAVEHDLLTRFEALLTTFLAEDDLQKLPTVTDFAERLGVSASYLGDMLRTVTGQSTQQHLHQGLIEKAKRLLRTTRLTVNETAFKLGFEYPQYFTRLFKSKTGQTPAEFRMSAN